MTIPSIFHCYDNYNYNYIYIMYLILIVFFLYFYCIFYSILIVFPLILIYNLDCKVSPNLETKCRSARIARALIIRQINFYNPTPKIMNILQFKKILTKKIQKNKMMIN